jgi:hypothetical protein
MIEAKVSKEIAHSTAQLAMKFCLSGILNSWIFIFISQQREKF